MSALLERRRHVFAAALVVLGAIVSGCSGPASTTAPPAPVDFKAVTDDLGGPFALVSLLDGPEATAEATLARYGVGLDVPDTTAVPPEAGDVDASIFGCPEFFLAADRNQVFWDLPHAGAQEAHYVDASGRPAAALKVLPPAMAYERSPVCQAAVGNWGTPPSDYDGGHLIGSQLGGWGRRANLVPQNSNFNRGNWAQIENALTACNALAGVRVAYEVYVTYSDASAITPTRFEARVTFSPGPSNSVVFDNVRGGGDGGTAKRQAFVAWLQSNGCR